MAPSRPSATNQPKLRPHSISTTGMSATLDAETRSDRMEMSRRLKRSRAAPPTIPMIICGTAQMSASVPAASASPVVASRMSGSATAAMELPRSESAFDAKKRGAMRVGCGFVCMGGSFLFSQKGSKNYDVASGSSELWWNYEGGPRLRGNEDSPTGNTLRLSLANRKIPCGFAIFARGMTPAPPMTIAEDGPSSKAPLRVTVITAVKRFGGFQCSRACTRGFRKSVSPVRERQGWVKRSLRASQR